MRDYDQNENIRFKNIVVINKFIVYLFTISTNKLLSILFYKTDKSFNNSVQL
jgi:hypothetical protein